MDMAGLVRNGQLHRLMGQADIPNYYGRPPRHQFQMGLFQSAMTPSCKSSTLKALSPAVELPANVRLTIPTGSPRVYLSIVLRHADVQDLTHAPGKKYPHGRLTASLTMGGVWNDTKTRRGHGDVLSVSGEDMYDIPIVLGRSQITNLALPISSPFSEATSRYSIDGPSVIFRSDRHEEQRHDHVRQRPA